MSNNNFITDDAEVKAWLALKCSTNQTPELTDPEIEILMREHEIGSVWEAEKVYKFDDVVVPTEGKRIGRRFRCVAPGTSGVTEPDWTWFIQGVRLIFAGADLGNNSSRSTTLHDEGALWVDDGSETDLWDLEDLANAAWLAKAGKAAELMRLNRGGNDYDLDAIFRHCVDMAGRFGGAFII